MVVEEQDLGRIHAERCLKSAEDGRVRLPKPDFMARHCTLERRDGRVVVRGTKQCPMRRVGVAQAARTKAMSVEHIHQLQRAGIRLHEDPLMNGKRLLGRVEAKVQAQLLKVFL